MTKKILKRKPTTKRKFVDGKTFIHPTLSYSLSDKRREMIDYVNHWIRLGLTFREIAPLINKSPSTVANYYYGFANHCLSSSQIEELKLISGSTVTRIKVISRIADEGEIPDRINVLMPVYTNITIREFGEVDLALLFHAITIAIRIKSLNIAKSKVSLALYQPYIKLLLKT